MTAYGDITAGGWQHGDGGGDGRRPQPGGLNRRDRPGRVRAVAALEGPVVHARSAAGVDVPGPPIAGRSVCWSSRLTPRRSASRQRRGWLPPSSRGSGLANGSRARR